MPTVTSKDRTRIAYWQSGKGPPLLLIHGATADHSTTWRFVAPLLERHFTVYAMDRRGRGGSGDGPAYDLQREAEDVIALADAIGEPLNVLGHSYGALCALEAARRMPTLRRLILYEGVPLDGRALYDPAVIARLDAMQAAGDREGILLTLYHEVVEMPPEEIDLLRAQQEAWAVRLRNAPTVPRELATEMGYRFEPERFRHVSAPTLLLVGGDSPPRERANGAAIAAALPYGRVLVLPGQQHLAMYTAPERFADAVVQFLLP